MTFNLERILESKRVMRRNLAARPVSEKLAMLDALRDREWVLRESGQAQKIGMLRDSPPPYQAESEKD
jgi:hypothetical protein